MFCEYFEARVCRSCPLMGVPYSQQVRDKERASRRALASLDRPSSRRNPAHPPAAKSQFEWLPTFRSPQKEFRNKAKMVVSGSKKSIVLGLAPTKDFPAGVDLESCPLYAPAIRAAFAPIRTWLQRLGARPYNIATAKGEVKYVLVSANPAGELMVRLVLRSKAALHRIENTWSELQAELPDLRVFSVNIQPEHTTVIEGREEIMAGAGGVFPDKYRRVSGYVYTSCCLGTRTPAGNRLGFVLRSGRICLCTEFRRGCAGDGRGSRGAGY